jgi:hypothetical protein
MTMTEDELMEKMRGKGPFTMINGQPSDSGIWAAEMDPEAEAKFDDYMLVVKVHRLAQEELARRQASAPAGITMESLMEELDRLEKNGDI